MIVVLNLSHQMEKSNTGIEMKLHRKQLVTAILYTCCLSLAGCQFGSKDRYAPVIATPQLVHSEILGYSVQDRPIELITI